MASYTTKRNLVLILTVLTATIATCKVDWDAVEAELNKYGNEKKIVEYVESMNANLTLNNQKAQGCPAGMMQCYNQPPDAGCTIRVSCCAYCSANCWQSGARGVVKCNGTPKVVRCVASGCCS